MKNTSRPVTTKQAPSGYGSRLKSWTTVKDAPAQATGKRGEHEPFDCSCGWSKNSTAGHEAERSRPGNPARRKEMKTRNDEIGGRGCPRRLVRDVELVTQRDLESVLTHEGIVHSDAVEDPEGYDGGDTELRISVAARKLNEIATEDIGPLLNDLAVYFGETCCHPLAIRVRKFLPANASDQATASKKISK